jgi:TolB protein
MTASQFSKSALIALLASAFTLSAQNELTVKREVQIPGTVKPIPVNISGFSGEVAQVIQFDLYVQGFSFVGPDAAQFLISGSNNGNVQGRVSDPHNKATSLSKAYSGASIRRQAHAFADDAVEAMTGKKGIAQTKVAFKVDTGPTSEIYISDFDGFDAKAVTADQTIVAAPCWAPGRLALYYTSYKKGNPDIYYHDLANGQRRSVASYSGLNTSAAVSPDGRRVAMILSKGGSPDVYVCDADGGNLKRLTSTREDESSPCWSPDGKWICFATKLKERRSLCKITPAGGEILRIPTSTVLNPTEPDWSPDGKWIVFTSMMGGFGICIVPAEGGTATQLVAGEDPSWASNSRTVIYARREGGNRILSLLDVMTKQTKDISRVKGSNSQPSWAK